MVAAYFNGLITGFTLSIVLGTVFFCLIQNSIDNGFKSGYFIATGVIVSDLLLIVVSYFNSNLFPSGGKTEIIARSCGALILIVMGISNIRSKKKVLFPIAYNTNPFVLALKGFMLNLLNPANYINWLAISVMLVNVAHYEKTEIYFFYGGALSGIFITEILIAYFASLLKKYITEKFLRRLDVILGIVFVVFAFMLLKPLVFAS